MLLTIYYMTSTCIQSWRLNTMKQTITQMLGRNASIVLYKEKNLDGETYGNYESLKLNIRRVTSEYCTNKTEAHVLDLWCYKYGKRGCSILPEQSINITNWISIPEKSIFFPLKLETNHFILNKQTIFVLLEANFLQNQSPDARIICELKNYGIPKAWTANEYFALILETDLEHLIKFSCNFMLNELYLNNVLEIIRLETVNVSGNPCHLLNSNRIPILIYSLNKVPYRIEKEVVENTSYRNFYIEMLRKIAKQAKELQQSEDTSRDLDYPPVTVTKAMPKNKVNQDQVNNKLPISGIENIELVKESKLGISRSCSEETSSMKVQPGSATCSLSVTSQYSTDTVIAESPLNPIIFNSIDDLSESIDWKTASRSSLLTTTSSTAGSFRKSSTPVSHRGEQKTGKPPTIMVFSESPSSVENIKNTLNSVLQKHRYTVYSLPLNDVLKTPWIDQASLVILCGNVPLSLKPLLLKYLLSNGGKLLCLCSDLLGVFLPTFKTAEVRPDEIVSFSYSKWNHITLLHHIFCYQPSPKSSKFSMDESPSSNTAFANTPSTVELRDTDSKPHTLQVKVLAAEETWQTPTLLLASDVESGGKALFSQVHVEVDSRVDSKVVCDPSLRLALVADLLSNHLGLECSSSIDSINYVPGYFLGRHEKKLEFLKTMADYMKSENVLQMKNTTLMFCGKGVASPEANERLLPIKLFDCPQNFSTVEYFENLKTKEIGRLVIYSEIMTSSMEILNGPPLDHGIVAISRQQTKGVGRGGNTWISPEGCAMFSLQLKISLSTNLGQKLALLQHITSLAIVSAICSEPNYKNLDLGLKWPNDIYAGGNVKIGGLIVTTSILDNVAVCNIGCGVNLSNSIPTTSINEMISEMNKTSNLKIPKLSAEKYYAIVFNQLEKLLELAQNEKSNEIFDLYYKYWLHNLAEVQIALTDGNLQTVVIIGIDDYGFLRVRSASGEIFSVHPDGNSFDMLRGLIASK